VSPLSSSFKEATTFAGKDGVFLPLSQAQAQAQGQADHAKEATVHSHGEAVGPVNAVNDARAFILSLDGLEIHLYDIAQQKTQPKPVCHSLFLSVMLLLILSLSLLLLLLLLLLLF
jgi:hypothetical protein